MVENAHGNGRTLLVGTHPSVDYYRTSAESGRRYFADVFAWTGRTQHVSTDNPNVQVRLHEGDGRTYLWLINATREARTGTVTVRGASTAPRAGKAHWAGGVPASTATTSLSLPATLWCSSFLA